MECLGPALDEIARCASDVGLDERRTQKITLAVEEALANICLYAYAEHDGGEVEVRCSRGFHGGFVVEIVDSGRAFNPLVAMLPDLSGDVEKLKEGGSGIPLIRAMADHVGYQRREGRNILELTMHTAA